MHYTVITLPPKNGHAFADHRNRPLTEHVDEWLAALKETGRDDRYTATVAGRLRRLLTECGWTRLDEINADNFTAWRETAMPDYGHNAKKTKEKTTAMGARTKNHYLEDLRAFCTWCVLHGRMAANPTVHVEKVDQSQDVRRELRALTGDELSRLLAAIPERYRLHYQVAMATGLRRNEILQLQWGDIHEDCTTPYIQLRAKTTKARRADSLPLRSDLAGALQTARGAVGECDRLFDRVPRLREFRVWLKVAGIPYVDDQGRFANMHALRHSYGTLLSKAGVNPREAMELMRHTDMRLTMKVYTDPRIFNLAAAVEKLPSLTPDDPAQQSQAATGTDANTPLPLRGANRVANIATYGQCSASIGNDEGEGKPKGKPMKTSDFRSFSHIDIKAGDGIRTRDHLLGRQRLYH